MYDLVIIGGGPAGTAAGVYAARKKLKTLLITKEYGGQSNVSPNIENWIGTVSISGDDLAKAFKEHLEAVADDVLEQKNGKVTGISKAGDGFEVKTENGSIQSKAVLVCSGGHRRKLNIPGAEKFENKGVTYCASCDGPLFSGQKVVVVGGGNAGFETAAQLLAYTEHVTLLHRSPEYKADPVTVEKVLANPKMTGLKNSEPTEILGDSFVRGVMYKDTTTGETHKIEATGVFVEIGMVPNTEFVEGLADLDDYKRIKIDPWKQSASVEGLWAAGDCTNVLYHQNNIAAGDAVRALEDIYLYLNAR